MDTGYAVLLEGGIVGFVGAGKGGGVGARGPGAEVGATYLYGDDGLAPFSCKSGDLHEFSGVLESLDKEGYDLCVVIIEHVAHEVGGFEVGFVASGDDVGVSDAAAYRP